MKRNTKFKKKGVKGIIVLIFVVGLVLIFIYLYLFFQFKVGDFVYEKDEGLVGEIKGISLFLDYLVEWQNGDLTEETFSGIKKLEDVSELDIQKAFEKNDTGDYNYYPGQTPTGIVLDRLNESNFSELETIPDFGKFAFDFKIKKGNCIPHFICEAWEGCKTIYNLEGLVKNEFALGIQYRYCKDSSGCMLDFFDLRECDARMQIDIKKVKINDDEYLEIYDKKSVLISRLNLINENFTKLNIQLLFDNSTYYPYCFDGQKNYDEDEIDCSYSGKNCPKCFLEVSSLKQNYSLILISLTVLTLLCFLCLVWYLFLWKRTKRIKKNLKINCINDKNHKSG